MHASPRSGADTPAVRALVETFVPGGSRCLHVGGRHDGALRRWMLHRGDDYVPVHPSELDAGWLPFEGESFDAGLLLGVLGLLDRPQHAAAEVRRVLRPGGVLLATVPNVAHWRRRLLGGASRREPRHAFTPRSLRRMLLGVGFDLVGVEGQGGAFVRAERLLPSLLGPQAAAFAIKV